MTIANDNTPPYFHTIVVENEEQRLTLRLSPENDMAELCCQYGSDPITVITTNYQSLRTSVRALEAGEWGVHVLTRQGKMHLSHAEGMLHIDGVGHGQHQQHMRQVSLSVGLADVRDALDAVHEIRPPAVPDGRSR